jgi:hypothetical protein
MAGAEFLETSSGVIWTKFADDIERVESKRRAAVRSVFGSFVLAFCIGMIGAPEHGVMHYALGCALFASLPALLIYRLLRRNQWLLNKPLSAIICRAIFGNAYKAWGIIEAEEMARHEILPDHCRLYREEGYSLNLHGYHIRFQEIDAVRSTHADSVREWHESSVGSGLYALIKLKRDLPAHTILITKKTGRTFLKRFIKKNIERYQCVGLVSPRFTDAFEVLTTDQVEARVAFHPAFMEKFMELASLLNSKDIEASFRDNELLIHARYKHDMFQLGHFFRPLTEADIDALMQELKIYSAIVETLKLNPYTAP